MLPGSEMLLILEKKSRLLMMASDWKRCSNSRAIVLLTLRRT